MANAFIIILAIVIILFFWLSGTTVTDLLNIPPPENDGVSPPGKNEAREEKEEIKNIRISNFNARRSDPAEEYIEIQADYGNTSDINITGWVLQNRDGNEFFIPRGAGLPYTGRVNIQENIELAPGEKAIIITGESPIGASFRPNLCTGYFNRLHDFNPRLPENCPRPDEEGGLDNQNDACFLYVKTLPRCQSAPQPKDIPSNIDFSCQDFLNQRLSYAACVENYKNEKGFFANEWRVYLEQNKEIWSDVRETIKLFDKERNLVSEADY